MSYPFNANCLKVIAISFFLLVFQSAFSQSYAEIDAILAQNKKLLGEDVIVMVANKDTVVYQKANKLFTPRVQAPIGHASQWLTAALILQLVDEGKLSLDDKVSHYLPEFAKYGKNYITLRHCLSHFTGIQAETPKALKLFERKKFASLEDEVASFAAKEIGTNPGTEFRYNTMGPVIAALVAEKVSKKKFDMLIQQKLFRPLGMRQTTFNTMDGSPPDPATGARTTASDYIRFLTMLLNNGSYKGQRILSEASVKQLRTIQTTPQLIKYAPEGTKGFEYALSAWAPEQRGEQEATVLTNPGFDGMLPIVDFCRGYAFLLLLKEEKDDPKAALYAPVKDALDNHFKGGCK